MKCPQVTLHNCTKKSVHFESLGYGIIGSAGPKGCFTFNPCELDPVPSEIRSNLGPTHMDNRRSDHDSHSNNACPPNSTYPWRTPYCESKKGKKCRKLDWPSHVYFGEAQTYPSLDDCESIVGPTGTGPAVIIHNCDPRSSAQVTMNSSILGTVPAKGTLTIFPCSTHYPAATKIILTSTLNLSLIGTYTQSSTSVDSRCECSALTWPKNIYFGYGKSSTVSCPSPALTVVNSFGSTVYLAYTSDTDVPPPMATFADMATNPVWLTATLHNNDRYGIPEGQTCVLVWASRLDPNFSVVYLSANKSVNNLNSTPGSLVGNLNGSVLTLTALPAPAASTDYSWILWVVLIIIALIIIVFLICWAIYRSRRVEGEPEYVEVAM